MGVLNVTPDSFSDGGQWLDPAAAVAHARQMVADGADVVDVGGLGFRREIPNLHVLDHPLTKAGHRELLCEWRWPKRSHSRFATILSGSQTAESVKTGLQRDERPDDRNDPPYREAV